VIDTALIRQRFETVAPFLDERVGGWWLLRKLWQRDVMASQP
jgi:hypothetical protein